MILIFLNRELLFQYQWGQHTTPYLQFEYYNDIRYLIFRNLIIC